MHPNRIGIFNHSRGGTIIQPNINSFENKQFMESVKKGVYKICSEGIDMRRKHKNTIVCYIEGMIHYFTPQGYGMFVSLTKGKRYTHYIKETIEKL